MVKPGLTIAPSVPSTGNDEIHSDHQTASSMLQAEDHAPSFLFPFTPWPIQESFMNTLYKGIQLGKILIMESPTGTGKSLSLICGSLQWLKDYENQLQQEKYKELSDRAKISIGDESDEPDWVLEHSKKEALREFEYEQEKKRKRAHRLAELRQAERDNLFDQPHKRIKSKHTNNRDTEEDDDAFLVDDYQSDSETTPSKTSPSSGHINPFDDKVPEEDVEEPDELKIIYCSRTHSQITQFVNEIKKTPYNEIKSVSLGSRKTMCINDDVRNLQSLPRINDKCLDLQKGSSKKEDARCPYLSKEHVKRENFRESVHAIVRDIEEIVQMGKRHKSCPYYGTRDALRPSQVVTLPYNLLLQKSARDSLGMNVKGNIIIIDEAHNLIDTITSIHSVSLSGQELERAKKQLCLYLQKYRSRLLGKNVAYIRQLILLISALQKALVPSSSKASSARSAPSTIKTVNDFVHELDIDHINLFKIERYLSESRLAQKLQGFVEKNELAVAVDAHRESDDYVSKHVSSVRTIESFLMCLTNADLEGRVVLALSENPALSTMKYLLLNPANCFRQIVEEARAVVFAGGTMEPVDDFLDELLPFVPSERISQFTCGHIIPSTSLLTLAVSSGPSNTTFNFNFENRDNASLVDELGSAVANMCNLVPGGVICFFASYEYLDRVYRYWEGSGLLKRIGNKKAVFREPKQAILVDSTLKGYSDSIANPRTGGQKNGAILLAVVGGKMSEGINFSDNMGRLVVMVGLPFPNMYSPDLQEKLKYIKARASLKGITAENQVAKDYYENICMKAVNQSIGRAIRHKDDYAAIVLLDHRYQQERIKKKLPGWIRDAGIGEPTNFGKVVGEIAKFFRGKRNHHHS